MSFKSTLDRLERLAENLFGETQGEPGDPDVAAAALAAARAVRDGKREAGTLPTLGRGEIDPDCLEAAEKAAIAVYRAKLKSGEITEAPDWLDLDDE